MCNTIRRKSKNKTFHKLYLYAACQTIDVTPDQWWLKHEKCLIRLWINKKSRKSIRQFYLITTYYLIITLHYTIYSILRKTCDYQRKIGKKTKRMSTLSFIITTCIRDAFIFPWVIFNYSFCHKGKRIPKKFFYLI